MSVCDICGAEVYKAQLHKAWHEAHDARFRQIHDRIDDVADPIPSIGELLNLDAKEWQ